LALFRRERPEMLISDIGLPEVDGYDLIQEIRREHGHASETIPAIALTAYARSEDRMRALRAGFHAHIAKPAEPAELLATIVSLAKLRDRRP
jgi:CheY-like chemotaxis protein